MHVTNKDTIEKTYTCIYIYMIIYVNVNKYTVCLVFFVALRLQK